MAHDDLKASFEWFIEHQDELVERHNGQFVVIAGTEVIGTFDDEFEAVRETNKTRTPGTFIVQRCAPGPDCYTTRMSSSWLQLPCGAA